VPYLVTKRWVYDQYHSWWHVDDRSSPSWVSRVRGQFPDQALNSLLKLSWDFGRELRVTRGKVIFSATADVQKSPLARAIQRFEPGIF